MSVRLGLYLVLATAVNIVFGVELCDRPADVAFVIDSSSSIYKSDFKKQIEFVQELVKTFNVGPDTIHVSALKFSHKVANEFYFNAVETAQEASERIGKITHAAGPATYTHNALKAVREDLFSTKNGARPDVSKVCVLLTDGQSTQPIDTLKEAKLAKADGITIVAVGIGPDVNDEELKQVVTDPATENYVRAKSFDDLKKKLFSIGKKACEVIKTTKPPPTTTTPTPTPTTSDQKDKPKKECQGKEADILFVVDMSSSIWSEYYKEQLQFLTDVISYFDINSGKTRVGMVTFSNNSRVDFYFDRYSTLEEITTAVLSVKQEGGLTNTHLALETARNEMFTEKHGSRGSTAAHICILITDGVSRVPEATKSSAQLLHKTGAYVFAIGVGDKPDIKELNYIASRPEYVYTVNGYGALKQFKEIVAFEACKEVPPEEIKDKCEGIKEDIVFVVDMSSSIWVVDFNNQIKFISELVGAFDINKDTTRVGMITYSTDTKVQFYLNSYNSKEELSKAILSVESEGGLTNTHLALQRMREEMMSKKHGFRPDVHTVVVVITDGESRQPKLTAVQASMLHQSGVDVIAIGVGSEVDKTELSNIASKPEYMFDVSGYDTLKEIKNILAETTCEVSEPDAV